jgi:hypothetical protein
MKRDVFTQLQELNEELQHSLKQLEGNGYRNLWAALAGRELWTIPNEITPKMKYRLSVKRYLQLSQAASWDEFYWDVVYIRNRVREFMAVGKSPTTMNRLGFEGFLLRVWAIGDRSKLMKSYLKDYCETLCRMANIVSKHVEIAE